MKINPNNEMTKTCPQQINQRNHRHRDPMVQGDGKDALSVWKIAEKVCGDFCCSFTEIKNVCWKNIHMMLFTRVSYRE